MTNVAQVPRSTELLAADGKSASDATLHLFNDLRFAALWLWASGTTAARPANPYLGQLYYDTTLGYIVECTAVGSPTTGTPATWTQLVPPAPKAPTYGLATGQTLSSNVLVDLTGLVLAMGVGTWTFIATISANNTSANALKLAVNHTGTVTTVDTTQFGQLSGTTLAATTRVTALATVGADLLTSTAVEGFVEIYGKIVVSVAGNFSIQGRCSTNSGAIVIRPSSNLMIFQTA